MDYGRVKKIPKKLQTGDYYICKQYDVGRTGELGQYYTLYCRTWISLVGYWSRFSWRYIKNLSLEKEAALAEARKISGEFNLDFNESPQAEIVRFEAFGLQWKKGKKAMYAMPNYNFWDGWKKNKEEIKKAGFWVSRGRDGFMVFFKGVPEG